MSWALGVVVRRELVLVGVGGHGMLVLDVDVADVSWHGELTFVFGLDWAVGPFECHACKAGTVKFFGDFVVLLESLVKMIQVGIANVLNCKVVDMKANMTGCQLCCQSPGVVAASCDDILH